MDADARLGRQGTFVRMVSAYARGDLEAFRTIVREDITFELPGSSPLAGSLRGIEPYPDLLERPVRSCPRLHIGHLATTGKRRGGVGGPPQCTFGSDQPLKARPYPSTPTTVQANLMALKMIASVARICPSRSDART